MAVCLLYFLSGFVRAEVIIAVAHVGTALIYVDDVHGAVFGIRSDVNTEERAYAVLTHACHGKGEVFFVLDGFNGLDVGFDWRRAQFVAAYAVHLHVIDVGDLLCYAAFFVLF